jgi:ATP-dependent DNA helicase DinG
VDDLQLTDDFTANVEILEPYHELLPDGLWDCIIGTSTELPDIDIYESMSIGGEYTLSLRPLDLQLPFSSWRKHQPQAILDIVENEQPVKRLSAPTGSGKSLLATSIPITDNGRSLIITKHKQLQSQYSDNMPVASLVGKNNYACVYPGYEDTTVTDAPCSTGFKCPLKDSCTYFVDRDRLIASRHGVTNYDYVLKAVDFESKVVEERRWIIFDEAQFLDDMLTNQATIQLTQAQRFKLRPNLSQLGLQPSNWKVWAESIYSNFLAEFLEISSVMNEIVRHLSNNSSVDPATYKSTAVKYRSARATLEILKKLKEVTEDYVIQVVGDSINFRPLWPADLPITRKVFENFPRTVLMSATVPTPDILSTLYNLPIENIQSVEVASSFPLENRMVYIAPVAQMSYAVEDREVVKAVAFINKVVLGRQPQKVLIHCNSGRLQQKIVDLIDGRLAHRILTHDSTNREAVLNKFRNSDFPSILISPSVESGLDIPDLQLQFIVKVLWMPLNDPWVVKRKDSNPNWYLQAAATNVIQAIGRVPRDEHTKAETYILDKNFGRFYVQAKRFFPDYVLQAIKWVNPNTII